MDRRQRVCDILSPCLVHLNTRIGKMVQHEVRTSQAGPNGQQTLEILTTDDATDQGCPAGTALQVHGGGQPVRLA